MISERIKEGHVYLRRIMGYFSSQYHRYWMGILLVAVFVLQKEVDIDNNLVAKKPQQLLDKAYVNIYESQMW